MNVSDELQTLIWGISQHVYYFGALKEVLDTSQQFQILPLFKEDKCPSHSHFQPKSRLKTANKHGMQGAG
jgi:hypothetical protein